MGLLEQIFLISTLQPWHRNAAKRLVKTPKLHFLDTGLLSGSLGLTAARVKTERKPFGAVLESFVHAEILKLLEGAGGVRSTLYHYRDHQQREVDIVLEREDGMVVGIEVKAGATVGPADFAGMRALAEASGAGFAAGVVLYDGETVVPFGGPNLLAAPLSCLWT